MTDSLFLVLTIIPFLMMLIPYGNLSNLLLPLFLMVGIFATSIANTNHMVIAVSISSILLYLFALSKLSSKTYKTKIPVFLFLSMPPAMTGAFCFFPYMLPIAAVIMCLVTILVVDNLSNSYQLIWDRILFLSIVAVPIFLVVYFYIPLIFQTGFAHNHLRLFQIFWLILLEAINVISLVAIYKGSIFKVNIKPSTEVTVKSFAFILAAVYVLTITFLELRSSKNSMTQISQLLIISGMIMGALAYSWKKGTLKGLRSYLLVNMYRERVDFYRLLFNLYELASTDKSWRDIVGSFLDNLIMHSGISGAKAEITQGDMMLFQYLSGAESKFSMRRKCQIISYRELVLTIYFPEKPDEVDRETYRLLEYLLGSFLSVSFHNERKNIDEKFELIGKLNRFIAHDMKNLSQNIKLYQGNLDALVSQPSSVIKEDLNELLEMLDEKTTKAINTLTTFVPPPPKARAFNLKEMVEKLIASFPFKNRINMEVPDVLMISDSDKITKILENLVVNAHQKDPDNVTITVRAYLIKDRVIVEVADSGDPIPLEHQDKIFDPFFSTKNGGLGLGLYIAKELSNVLNGDITYYDTSLETVFQLVIPRDIREPIRV